MTCTRCQGLMVDDQLFDMEGAYGEMWTTSRRCLNCGEVQDAVIAQHRRLQRAQVVRLSRGESDQREDDVDRESEACVRLAA